MSGDNPISDLGLSCPREGKFYICKGAETQFIGCCTEDPCVDGTGYCPPSALRNSSYSQVAYREIPPQSCEAPNDESSWYTCSDLNPPFMGCCSSNPCANNGCAAEDLLAARVSDNATYAAPFLASTSGSSSSGSGGLSTGAIVGVAIGSAAAVLIVVGILFFLYRRREKKRKDELAAKVQPSADGTPGAYMPSPYQGEPIHPHSPTPRRRRPL